MKLFEEQVALVTGAGGALGLLRQAPLLKALW
jgi:hypothetical protein